jgi:hypothetical protein
MDTPEADNIHRYAVSHESGPQARRPVLEQVTNKMGSIGPKPEGSEPRTTVTDSPAVMNPPSAVRMPATCGPGPRSAVVSGDTMSLVGDELIEGSPRR